LAKGLGRETLRERIFAHLPTEVFRGVIAHLEDSGTIVSEKDLIRRPEHILDLSADDVALQNQLNSLYQSAGLEPPTLDDALQRVATSTAQKTHARKILQLLLDGGSLLRIHGDLLFHETAIAELTAKLKKFAAEHREDPSIDVATFKELAGVSRKYAIPLLEYLDRSRVTRRAGDRRQILN
jgi:selenocysteine-specific elongation factor